ncbi:MAG: hypothetical protein HOH19_14030 [Kordiimonadaceae bacterium]|nr:hypothetical protein [Kordiimonadaceae bacterium]
MSQADVVLVDWFSRLRDRRTGHKLPVARFTRVLVGGDCTSSGKVGHLSR